MCHADLIACTHCPYTLLTAPIHPCPSPNTCVSLTTRQTITRRIPGLCGSADCPSRFTSPLGYGPAPHFPNPHTAKPAWGEEVDHLPARDYVWQARPFVEDLEDGLWMAGGLGDEPGWAERGRRETRFREEDERREGLRAWRASEVEREREEAVEREEEERREETIRWEREWRSRQQQQQQQAFEGYEYGDGSRGSHGSEYSPSGGNAGSNAHGYGTQGSHGQTNYPYGGYGGCGGYGPDTTGWSWGW